MGVERGTGCPLYWHLVPFWWDEKGRGAKGVFFALLTLHPLKITLFGLSSAFCWLRYFPSRFSRRIFPASILEADGNACVTEFPGMR